LPQLRGRAAIAWSILLGLSETGTSLFLIDDGMDSGALLAQRTFQIDPRETAATLIEKHMAALTAMLHDLLPRLADGTTQPIAQRTINISYGAKRVASDGVIDWTRPVAEIDRLIRASTRPYPGAFTFTRKRRVQIWTATPIKPAAIWFGHPGQVVFYDETRPVVLCGDGGYLRIDALDVDGRALSGQVRFLDRIEQEIRHP
jgi:methionyl-tRNA formyltransferase